MYVYMYRAALYCEECGIMVMDELDGDGQEPTADSETWPQGPYSNGGGESDTPQHCALCEMFLENPLTADGVEYVTECIKQDAVAGRTDSVSVTEWGPFYGLTIEEDPPNRQGTRIGNR